MFMKSNNTGVMLNGKKRLSKKEKPSSGNSMIIAGLMKMVSGSPGPSGSAKRLSPHIDTY